MKKTIFALSAVVLVLGLMGCSKNGTKKKIKIGVIQLVEHPALDGSYKGFVDGLAEAGFVDGENISIDYQNARMMDTIFSERTIHMNKKQRHCSPFFA